MTSTLVRSEPAERVESPRSGPSGPTTPFLKWPGGKRWIAPAITEFISGFLTNNYYEPFLGGAAVFFQLAPKNARLSDVNCELINTYCMVRDFPDFVLETLRAIPVNKREYFRQRRLVPEGRVARAARFLYLNRTAFGGIYRLNARGEFNVPYGGGQRRPDILWDRSLINSASLALRDATLRTSDFEGQMRKAGEGDVVYCDPTYTVKHDNNGFVRYNERVFSWSDQLRLANAAISAVARGALVIVSNAHHDTIRKLYPKNAAVVTASRMSCVSTQVENRTPVSEYVVILRPS